MSSTAFYVRSSRSPIPERSGGNTLALDPVSRFLSHAALGREARAVAIRILLLKERGSVGSLPGPSRCPVSQAETRASRLAKSSISAISVSDRCESSSFAFVVRLRRSQWSRAIHWHAVQLSLLAVETCQPRGSLS